MNDHASEFMRLYVSGMVSLLGVVFIFRGRALCTAKIQFRLELGAAALKDRFRDTLERRDAMEGLSPLPWRIMGSACIGVGALVFFRMLEPMVGYALLCAGLAATMSQIYLSMRNRTPRRAAVLQPRTPASVVPPFWYVAALFASIIPLQTWGVPQLRTGALIVVIASLFVVFVAYRTSSMAALLAGVDPEIEVFVDNRLRWARVSSLLLLAFAISFAFMGAAEAWIDEPSAAYSIPFVTSGTLMFLYGAWWAIVFFRGRMRAPVAAI
jgi:hypothetical protein